MEIQTLTVKEYQTAVTHHISKLKEILRNPKLVFGNKEVVFIEPLIHKTTAQGLKVNFKRIN